MMVRALTFKQRVSRCSETAKATGRPACTWTDGAYSAAAGQTDGQGQGQGQVLYCKQCNSWLCNMHALGCQHAPDASRQTQSCSTHLSREHWMACPEGMRCPSRGLQKMHLAHPEESHPWLMCHLLSRGQPGIPPLVPPLAGGLQSGQPEASSQLLHCSGAVLEARGRQNRGCACWK